MTGDEDAVTDGIHKSAIGGPRWGPAMNIAQAAWRATGQRRRPKCTRRKPRPLQQQFGLVFRDSLDACASEDGGLSEGTHFSAGDGHLCQAGAGARTLREVQPISIAYQSEFLQPIMGQ